MFILLMIILLTQDFANNNLYRDNVQSVMQLHVLKNNLNRRDILWLQKLLNYYLLASDKIIFIDKTLYLDGDYGQLRLKLSDDYLAVSINGNKFEKLLIGRYQYVFDNLTNTFALSYANSEIIKTQVNII